MTEWQLAAKIIPHMCSQKITEKEISHCEQKQLLMRIENEIQLLNESKWNRMYGCMSLLALPRIYQRYYILFIPYNNKSNHEIITKRGNSLEYRKYLRNTEYFVNVYDISKWPAVNLPC